MAPLTVTFPGVRPEQPGPGQESVWDYPRPPRVEATTERVVVEPVTGISWCEFKGTADYLDVVVGESRASRAAWTYPAPTPGFEALRDHVALYPGLMDGVTVAGEPVRPQEGGFYGGWITDRVVGPFKGAGGTKGW